MHYLFKVFSNLYYTIAMVFTSTSYGQALKGDCLENKPKDKNFYRNIFFVN